MTSVDPPLPKRSGPPSKSTLHFGFIPQSVIARFQSTEYQQRVDASAELLELIQNSDFSDIDVHSLLMFIEPYSSDQNYLIAQNVAQVVSALINQTVIHGLTCAPYLHQMVHIVLFIFEDRRRTVCQLGQDIFVDLLSSNDHYSVICEVVRSSSTPHPKVSVEVFRCFTNLITQGILEPSQLLQFPFYFDAMLLSPHKNVKQSVLWCIDYIKNHYASDYNTLISLMSREVVAIIGKGTGTPTTAVAKSRQDSIVVNRVLNTAGKVEAAKAKASLNFTRSLPLSRNQYQRPSLPSGKGARQINFLASMSRPVSSKSATTFLDDDQPPNFVSIEEETGNQESYSIPDQSPQDDIQQFDDDDNNDNDILLPPLKEAADVLDVYSSNTNKRYNTESITNSGNITANPSINSKKKTIPQPKKRLITFDASVFPPKNDDSETIPSAKQKQRHITFLQNNQQANISSQNSQQGNLIQTMINDNFGDPENSNTSGANDSDRPIKSSGFYNLGDDINFPSDNVSDAKLANANKKKKPQFSISLKRPFPKKHPQSSSSLASSLPKGGLQARLEVHPQPQKPPKIEKLIEKLKSDEWSDQNDSIIEMMNNLDQLIQGINSNLREIVTSLLECSASLRSMLSKNALNCLQKMIKSKSIDFEPISDMCASSLLQLITVHKSKHFIYELSGETFAALIENISTSKATDILKNEHKRKHDDARLKIAFCMASLVQRSNDFAPLLKPLVFLVQDRNPDVRKYAKSAVAAVKQKSPNFDQLLNSTLVNEDERKILNAI